jgi:pimeloyl-ACP methyl ester carboxylesterase
MTAPLPHPGPNLGDTVAVLQSLELADGRRMAVRTWPGTGDETIVFLHGLLDSSEGWAATCERRDGSDGRPTLTRIAFDLPGFGESDPPPAGSFDAYARDVAAGLDLMGVGRFLLVGHSLGGGVATRLAELLPDRVEALVLLAPAGFGRIRLADLVSLPGVRDVVGLGLPMALSNRLAVGLSYRLMVTNGDAPDRDLLDRLVRGRGPQLVAGARAAIAAIALAGRSADAFHRRIIAFNGPVVAIWGDHDRLVSPSHRHTLARSFPQARIEVWAGMGHHPQRERLEDLLTVIRRVSVPGQIIALPRAAAAASA